MIKKLSLTLATFALFFTGTLASANMNNHDYTERSGAPSSSLFLKNGLSDSRLPGITFLRPVMSGVLYRSGVGNGKSGLSSGQLQDLCEAGFAYAMIVDFTDASPKTVSCANGSIQYIQTTSRKGADKAMSTIYNAIKADRGPVIAHCRNGVHASNVISAKALVRFCDWSISEAKAYWQSTRNNSPCSGGCDKWINDKFSGFSEGDGGMPLSQGEKVSFCPISS